MENGTSVVDKDKSSIEKVASVRSEKKKVSKKTDIEPN